MVSPTARHRRRNTRPNLACGLFCALMFIDNADAAGERIGEGDRSPCLEAATTELTIPAVSGPLNPSELAKCDEQVLYYGLGQPPNPAAALQCGLYQREHPNPTSGDPFYGAGVLSMLFANGLGVPRNFALAIRFTCENHWAAPAEIEARIQHLEALRAAGESTGSFDLCDDRTSGLMMGACAGIRSTRLDAIRDRELHALHDKLPPAVQKNYEDLARAEHAFEDAHVSNEMDLSGTGRVAFAAEEGDRLGDQFLSNIKMLTTGRIPSVTSLEAKAADQELNAVYQQLMRSLPRSEFPGEIRPEGVKRTERVWVKLRDAFIAFGRAIDPNMAAEQVGTLLTKQRVLQLQKI